MYVLNFKIELKSDYHIASGTGLGAWCDSTLLKNQADFPYIPGSSLAGLLRQGARDLLEQSLLKDKYNYCETGKIKGSCKKGDKLCVMCYLFGSPKHPGQVRVGTAFPVEEQDGVSDQSYSKNRHFRYRSSMDVRTRRAREKHLFGREEGGAQVFSFQVECPNLVSAAFMVAAARMVRGLGSGRRRGSGSCLLHIDTIKPWPDGISNKCLEKEMLEFFYEHWVGGNANFNVKVPAHFHNKELDKKVSNGKVDTDQNSNHPWRARLVVHLKEPLLVSRRGKAGASFESFEGIPGSTMAGALLARSFKSKGNGPGDIIVELIRDGKISIPFLTLAELRGRRLYPALAPPFNLAGCKKADSFVYPSCKKHPPVNRLLDKEMEARCSCGSQLEEPRHMLTLQKTPLSFEPMKRLETHINIDPSTGRVPVDSLYRYIVLTEGQWLIGDILCDSPETWKLFKESASIPDLNEEFELFVGKAWRKGYGRCRSAIIQEGAARDLVDSWIGVDIKERFLKDQPLTMTLLTDTIIQDYWGRFLTSLDRISTLEDELRRSGNCPGIRIEELGPSFSHSRSVDSFNTRSGLPRSRDIALMAGSTIQFVIDFGEHDSLSCLQQIELNGIGLRRTEGFGRIAFNHPLSLIINSQNLYRPPIPQKWLFNEQTQKITFEEWLEQYVWSEYQETIGEFITDQTSDNWTAFARILRSAGNFDAAVEKLGKVPPNIADELQHRDKKGFFEDKRKGLEGIGKLQEIWGKVHLRDKWTKSDINEETRERLLAQHLSALISSVAASKRRDG